MMLQNGLQAISFISITWLLFSLLPFTSFCQNRPELNQFLENYDTFLSTYVTDGLVDYRQIKNSPGQLNRLVDFVHGFDFRELPAPEKKAYLINAYNLMVIEGVMARYPIPSLLKATGFFDRVRHRFGPLKITLDALERRYLLSIYVDPRVHFAISCAAKGCPPLAGSSYRSEILDLQLDEQTRKFINDPITTKVNEGGKELILSQIFNWYRADFGLSKNDLLGFVNRYRDQPISSDYAIGFYYYDWRLNDADLTLQPNNTSRYVVSSAIPEGTLEVKWFNNLYSQTIPQTVSADKRDVYFTSLVRMLYGVTSWVNLGLDLRFRRVAFFDSPVSPFQLFNDRKARSSRGEIAQVGPAFRVAPNPKWPNFSMQSAIWFPVTPRLEGNQELPWLDWENPTWWTQLANDFSVGRNFALYAELGLSWEDMGAGKNAVVVNQISTPVTLILQYYPSPVTTVYSLTGFSPFWRPNLDYFAQAGLGFKYQFSRYVEAELLYTYFINDFLLDINGRASTINFGLRFSQ